MIQDHPKCVTCSNRVIGTETIVSGPRDVKNYLVSRCKTDHVQFKKMEHPFGKDAKGPVLTCREMLLNGCRDFKLWQPIKMEKQSAKQSPCVPHAV